jgi:hypothetical protein
MKKDIRILLIGINALLFAVVIILVLGRQTHWQPPKPISPALSQTVSAGFLTKFDLQASAYPQITQHPLFWPSRKPPLEKKVEPVPVAAPDSLKDVTLLGTFNDNAVGGAIIRLDKKKEVIRLVVGEDFNGMKLLEVSPISALFGDAGHHQQTLTIEYAKQADQPRTPVKSGGANPAQGHAPVFDRWVPKQHGLGK